tara:strand:+ start:513 stop:644 length:132 start_codon:yes stop_codon:yes gene_type:complete
MRWGERTPHSDTEEYLDSCGNDIMNQMASLRVLGIEALFVDLT